jgi:two-component system NtrC family sensor kinase
MGIEVPDPHLNMAFDRNTKPADKPANIGTDHAIEELTRQNKRLAIIHQIAKKINVEMSIQEIIDSVAVPLRGVLPYDLLSFCLIEDNSLVITSSMPKDQKTLGTGWVITNHNSAPWKAIKEKRCYMRSDIWNDSHKYQEDDDLRSIGIRTSIMAPMVVSNMAIGSVNFGSTKAYVYSENDAVFAQQLADQLAVCIHNTRLYSQVSESEREWEETFKAVAGDIFIIDRSFNVLRCNKQNSLLKKNDVQYKCYDIFACCGDECSFCPAVEAFESGQMAVREMTDPQTKNIFHINAYPIYNEQNKLYGVVVYITDITARRRMESQLYQSEKLIAIGEMAAGVAHELNSPLTAVIGNCNLILRRTSKTDKHYNLLLDIKKCGLRSKGIIQNLLTFARQDIYIFEGIFINEVVTNSLSLIAYQIERNNIHIIKNLSDDLPLIKGNKQQLEQVLINFLINARDAFNDVENNIFTNNRITISTGMKSVDRGEKMVFVEVADNGKGISEKIVDHIFTPFFTTKAKSRGTGLGLSVSLGIAQAHGGTIEVSSEMGEGSTFTLLLPAAMKSDI